MHAATVAVATCAAAPDIDEHDAPLLPALAEHGVGAVTAVWDDPEVDWQGFDLVVLRATWDYPERREAFLRWIEQVEQTTTVCNGSGVAAWNSDKRYLSGLASQDVPVVPTRFLSPGDPLTLPSRGEFVVKPAISAGSRDTARYDAARDSMRAVRHVQGLMAAGRTVMLQPYIDTVDAGGETALMFIDGELSHAVRKGPLLRPGARPTEELYAPEEITPHRPSADECAAAASVLSALPKVCRNLLYARVDLLATDAGPVLLEIELIEPSLFLGFDDDAPQRLADAIVSRLG